MINKEDFLGPVIGAALAFIATWFWKRSAMAKSQRDEIASLKLQMEVLKQAVVPISTAFQAIIIKELTHFHTPEMDGLMSRIGPPSTLTMEEEVRLAVLLKQRAVDMGNQISNRERAGALMLPLLREWMKTEEVVVNADAVQLKIVAVHAAGEAK